MQSGSEVTTYVKRSVKRFSGPPNIFMFLFLGSRENSLSHWPVS